MSVEDIHKIVSDYVDDYMKQSLKIAKRHFNTHTRFVEDMVGQQTDKVAALIREQGDSIVAIFVKNNQLVSKRIGQLEDRVYKLEHR